MTKAERFDAIQEIKNMVPDSDFMDALAEYLLVSDIEGMREYLGIEDEADDDDSDDDSEDTSDEDDDSDDEDEDEED